MSNMQAVDLLMLFDTTVTNIGPPPTVIENWVDNLGNQLISNTGDSIVFNVP